MVRSLILTASAGKSLPVHLANLDHISRIALSAAWQKLPPISDFLLQSLVLSWSPSRADLENCFGRGTLDLTSATKQDAEGVEGEDRGLGKGLGSVVNSASRGIFGRYVRIVESNKQG